MRIAGVYNGLFCVPTAVYWTVLAIMALIVHFIQRWICIAVFWIIEFPYYGYSQESTPNDATCELIILIIDLCLL